MSNLENIISETVRAAVREAKLSVALQGPLDSEAVEKTFDDSNDVTVVVVNVIPVISGQIRIERDVEL